MTDDRRPVTDDGGTLGMSNLEFRIANFCLLLNPEPRTLNAEPVNRVYVRRPAPEKPYGHLHPAASH